MMWPTLSWQELWRESDPFKPSVKLGSLRTDENGGIWRYIQGNAAMAKGDLVMKHVVTGIVAALDADIDTASINHSLGGARFYDANNFTAANLKGNWFDANPVDGSTLYAGLGHDYWIGIDAGAAQGQWGYIYNRESTGDYVDAWVVTSSTSPGRLDTALTTSSDYIVYTDSLCIKTTAATDVVVGVAQKAITADCCAWTLVKGKGIIGWITAADLTTDDQALIPTSTAGKCGAISGSPAAVEVLAMVGRACSLDITADGTIFADIDILRNVSPVNSGFMPRSLLYEWPRRH